MDATAQTISIPDAVKLALEHCDAGRLPKAEQIYRQILGIRPDDADALHLLGAIARRVGRTADAVALIARAIEHAPGEPSYRNSLGEAQRALGEADDAIASYRQAVEIEPDFVEALANLGDSPREKGCLDEAVASYRRALDIAPNNVEIWCNLGVVFEQQGEFAQAVASHRRALAIEPKLAVASYNLGSALHRQGKLELAAAAYRAALDVNPNFTEAHNNLGSVFREQGELADAAASFRQAIATDSRYVPALSNLGIVLKEQGKPDQAILSCKRALEIDPDYAKAHSNLASVLGALGRPNDALAAYRKVVEIEPSAVTARHMVAALTGSTTEAPPRGYVENLFDGYSRRFEDHVVNDLGYHVPRSLRRLTDRLPRSRLPRRGPRFRRALDLGSGTGLVGSAFRDVVEELHGVDVSTKMVRQARLKAVYDVLHVDEIVAFLERTEEREREFDLMTAGDVFIYVGKLEPVFAAARRRMSVDGLFAFSVESLAEGDFALRQSGRYAHSDGYIRRLARESGFAVAGRQDVTIRTEREVDIEGAVFALARVN